MRDLQHSEAAAWSQWCMQCMQLLPYGGCRIIRCVPRAASGRPSGQQAEQEGRCCGSSFSWHVLVREERNQNQR